MLQFTAELELSEDTEKPVSSETISLTMTTPLTEDIEEMGKILILQK